MKNNVKKIIASILIASIVFSLLSITATAFAMPKSKLEYNEVMDEYGNWRDQGGYYNLKWDKYNCYSFAISRAEDPQFYPSGNDFRYSPGNISGNNTWRSVETIGGLAELVFDDLLALGYTDILISDEIPTIIESEELICIRRNNETGSYHVMMYDLATNAWYHKPGNTAVLKYTHNDGIPSNNKIWYIEMSHSGIIYYEEGVYDSNIKFIKYSKNQLFVPWGEEVTNTIDVKAGKDVIYEIIVDKSDSYDIKMSSQNGEFTYEIYFYNKFNGDYEILKNGTSDSSVTDSVYISAMSPYYNDEPGWELQANRYYLRLHYNKNNTSDKSISVSIEHSHSYNDGFDAYSAVQHKAYCECGEYITASHEIVGGVCTLCGEPHEHSYNGECVWKSFTYHRNYCECGDYLDSAHVVSAGAFGGGNKYAFCLACGGRAEIGIVLSQAIGKLPCSENGSFILPNGVIVLVDGDIEAYFDGRLEFGYPDDNLETE